MWGPGTCTPGSRGQNLGEGQSTPPDHLDPKAVSQTPPPPAQENQLMKNVCLENSWLVPSRWGTLGEDGEMDNHVAGPGGKLKHYVACLNVLDWYNKWYMHDSCLKPWWKVPQYNVLWKDNLSIERREPGSVIHHVSDNGLCKAWANYFYIFYYLWGVIRFKIVFQCASVTPRRSSV